MDYTFAGLINALEELLDVHGRLLALSEEKSRAILERDTDALNAVVQQEMRLMQQSNAAEKRRGDIAAELGRLLVIPAKAVTLSSLAKAAPPAEGLRLTELGRELTQLLTAQKETNARVRNMLDAHIEYSDMMLNLMVGPEDPLNNLYSAGGVEKKDMRQSPGLFDIRG